jgi:hypothetical protein
MGISDQKPFESMGFHGIHGFSTFRPHSVHAYLCVECNAMQGAAAACGVTRRQDMQNLHRLCSLLWEWAIECR